MSEMRLPLTIEEYTPGQLEQRWCEKCNTPNGWYLPFDKTVAHPDPEAPPALAALGCNGCSERSAARAKARGTLEES